MLRSKPALRLLGSLDLTDYSALIIWIVEGHGYSHKFF